MQLQRIWPTGVKAQAFLLTSLIFILLQIWRPCFFLVDDNLAAGMPIVAEIGRNMWEGKSVFYSYYLFGGHYNLQADPTFIFWHPFYFFVAFLAPLGGAIYYSDILAFLDLQIGVIGFVALAEFFRKKYSLILSDGRLLFYALSFDFNLYVLNVGSSWGDFLVNHSVLPWLTLAIWQKSWRGGWALATLMQIHEILAGHSVMTISNALVFTVAAIGLSLQQWNWRPALIWFTGNLAAGLICLPILMGPFAGFSHSARAAGLSIETMTMLNIPFQFLFLSLLSGAWTGLNPNALGIADILPIEAFVGCAAAFCIVPALLNGRWFNKVEQLIFFMLLVLSVMIIRPFWLSEIFSHLPLLKSLRWPFRELLQFQFFFHLFLVVRQQGLSESFQRVAAFGSVFVFVLPFLFVPIPALNQTKPDRELIFSGEAARYWEHVKAQLAPGEMIVPVVATDVPLERQSSHEIPQCLIGDGNYPAYFKIVTASGYSPAAPLDNTVLKMVAYWPYGSFSNEQVPTLIAYAHNHGLKLRIITVENQNPLRVGMIQPGADAQDLTPFIPQRYTVKFKEEPKDSSKQ